MGDRVKKVRIFVSEDKTSISERKRNLKKKHPTTPPNTRTPRQVMQRQSLTTSHKQTDAQSVSEQRLPP